MALFNKQLDKNIVQADANAHQHKIPEQLNAPRQRGAWKDDGPAHIKTQWESYRKGNQESRGIRLQRKANRRMHQLLPEQVMKAEIKNGYIEQCIATAAGCIPKGL